jgi:peptidyl-prolyl cis-trans isomerase A (cyclophilin A)
MPSMRVLATTLPVAVAVAIGPVALVVSCGSGPSAAPATPVDAVPVEAMAVTAASAASPADASAPAPAHRGPEDLDPARASRQAPDVFSARFATTKGDFVVEVRRSWAPHGADRFFNLVSMGFYDDTRFFRAIAGFMVQFGIPADPAVAGKWQDARIADDPVLQSNRRGLMAFAQTGAPNSRTTQVFIDYGDNAQLDASNFAPFGKVVQGMNVVDSLYAGYGEGAPNGTGPSQSRVQTEGNAYLDGAFPKLDRILNARVLSSATP